MKIISSVFRHSVSGLVALGVVSLCACSASDDGTKAVEVPSATLPTIDAPQAELFDTARQLYRSGLFTVSKESFQSLVNGYPLGPYTEFAQIKVADCEFYAGDYASAGALYESFVSDHPGSSAAPYMLHQAGYSYLLASRGVGRDVSPLEKSLTHFNKLAERYPNSPYAPSAEFYRKEVFAQLAEHDQLILDFYKRRDYEDAYQARKQAFQTKWASLLDKDGNLKTTHDAPEVLNVTRVAAMPNRPEMPQAVSVKSQVIPANKQIAEDGHSITDISGQPNSPPSQTVRASLRPDSESEPSNELEGGGITVRQLKCQAGSPEAVYVYLNSPLPQEVVTGPLFRTGSVLHPVDGRVQVALPKVTTREPLERTCFGNNQVTISTDGVLEMKTSRTVTLFQVANPPRIILIKN